MQIGIFFLFIGVLLGVCYGSPNKVNEIQNQEPLPTKTAEVIETPPKTEDPGLIIETPPVTAMEEVLEYVGCFKDNGSNRALPVLYDNFRLGINWFNMKSTIKKCADSAKARGYKYFGVQFFGECWSGPEAATSFDKYGLSKNCWEGVGRHWTNAVYKFTLKEKTTENVIS